MKKKKVSIKDIAKEVGVSIATISYVLSNSKGGRVSKKMAEKIHKVAEEMNYQPNQIAKSLKSGKTYTIGLIVADISNPFFAQIARIIEDEAAKSGYIVIFGSSDENAATSDKLVQFFLNRQVDGFIIVPTEHSQKQVKYLKKQNVPFVLLDRIFPDLESNYVIIDNYMAAYEAVSRLIETGHEKIAMIAFDSQLYHMRERIRGYEKSLEDHKIIAKKERLKELPFESIEAEVNKAMDEIFASPEPVSALFFATNTISYLGIKYLIKNGIRVPDDVAIVCFDEGEAYDFYYCPITYVRQPIEQICKKAVEILLSEISNPGAGQFHSILKTELIIRKSCGAPVSVS